MDEPNFEKQKAQLLRKTRWWHNLCQNAVCYYCGTGLTPQTATMDHILPISEGGKSTKGNVVPACKTCNSQKKSMSATEWEEYLAEAKKKNKAVDSMS